MKIETKKKLRYAAIVFCAVGLTASAAMAQQDAPPPPDGQRHGPPGGPGGRGGPERRIEMLQKRLSLSTDQTTQVKTIFGEEHTKSEALWSNTALSREDRRSQMKAIHEDGQTKFEALLTPDQKTKYEAMEAKMREHDEHRGGPDGPPHHGGDGPPPPPPPAAS